MKSFDDFLKEFEKQEKNISLKDVASKIDTTDTTQVVAIIASGMALIDQRAEDRLRAYHEWMSKNS